MDFVSIQGLFLRALIKLLQLDRFLLEKNLNERSISHKLACYLSDDFHEWDVDCEYNRNHDLVKRLDWEPEMIESRDTEAKTVFPDIIVHIRNSDANLLIIEIKKDSNEGDRQKDLKKIKGFMEQLGYKYGLFINFLTGSRSGIRELVWFIDGNKVSKEINLAEQSEVLSYKRRVSQSMYKLYALTPEEIRVVENLRNG